MAAELLGLGLARKASVSDAPLSSNVVARGCCGAGCGTLSVAANGAVYPCHLLHDARFEMGDLFDGTVEEAQRSAVRESFRRLDPDRLEGCSECGIRYLCGGGCRARSVFSNGSIDGKDPYCLLMKEYYGRLEGLVATSIEAQGRG